MNNDQELRNSSLSLGIQEQYHSSQQPILYEGIESLIFSHHEDKVYLERQDLLTPPSSQLIRKSNDPYSIQIEGVKNRRNLFCGKSQTQTEFFTHPKTENQEIFDKTDEYYLTEKAELEAYSSSEENRKIYKRIYQAEQSQSVKTDTNGDILVRGSISQYNPILQNMEEDTSQQVLSGNSEQSQENKNKELQLKSCLYISEHNNQSKRYASIKIKNTKRGQMPLYSKRATIFLDPINMQKSSTQNQAYQSQNNQLVVITYLKKFINQLLLSVAYRDFRVLEDTHLAVIDDKTSFTAHKIKSQVNHLHEVESNEVKSILQKRNNLIEQDHENQHNQMNGLSKKAQDLFYNTFYLFWMKSKALEPSALIIILWEIFFLCLLLSQLVLIPIKGCFSSVFLEEDSWSVFLYQIPIVCFVMDIVIGFHTGYYQFGMAVMDKKLIAIKYLSHKFWIDFSCTVLLSSNLLIKSTIIDFLAMFLRINQMKMKMDKIDQHFRLSYKMPIWTQIIRLIMLVIFLAHLCGCFFHLVGETSGSYQSITSQGNFPTNFRSWIHQQGLEDKDWVVRYISALYFSIISMITIGYGDIAPINQYEKIYVIGITFITCGTFAYCINTIGNIFAQQDQKSKTFNNNQYQLQSYLDYMQTPKDIQLRVLKYFEYLNEQSDEAILKGASVFEECSQDLKEEVIRGSYMKLLLENSLFRKTFSKEFLQCCSVKMTEKRYGPGETLVSQDQKLNSLIILTKGDSEHFYMNKNFKRCVHVIESKIIDLQHFITQSPVELAIRAKSVVSVVQISYKEFIECLHMFPIDYEKFCMIRDQIQFDNRQLDPCYTCKQYGHSVSSCPQIHFSLRRSHFAKKVYFSQEEESRKSHKRKSLRIKALTEKMQATLNLKIIRLEAAKAIYSEYFEMDIQNQLAVIEKDKQFLRRCPKINRVLFQRIQKDEIIPSNPFKEMDPQRKEWEEDIDQVNQHNELSSEEFQSQTDSSDENTDQMREDKQNNEENQFTPIMNNNNNNVLIANNNDLSVNFNSNNYLGVKQKKSRDSANLMEHFLQEQVSMKMDEEIIFPNNNSNKNTNNSNNKISNRRLSNVIKQVSPVKMSEKIIPSKTACESDIHTDKNVGQISPSHQMNKSSSIKNFQNQENSLQTNSSANQLQLSNYDLGSNYLQTSLKKNSLIQERGMINKIIFEDLQNVETLQPHYNSKMKLILEFLTSYFSQEEKDQEEIRQRLKKESLGNNYHLLLLQLIQQFQGIVLSHQQDQSQSASLQNPSPQTISYQTQQLLYSNMKSSQNGQNLSFQQNQGQRRNNNSVDFSSNRRKIITYSKKNGSKKNFLVQKKNSILKNSNSYEECKTEDSGIKNSSKEQGSQSQKQSAHQAKQQWFQTNTKNDSLLFGPLGFKFDIMKEFVCYFPKNNYSNVVKSYKKSHQRVVQIMHIKKRQLGQTSIYIHKDICKPNVPSIALLKNTKKSNQTHHKNSNPTSILQS